MPKVDTTVRELVDLVRRGELRLPEMQRRYVWPGTRVRDLLDSLYRGYPSGSILVWETEHETPTRDLAVAQATSAFMTHKLLLDGQQRVTSLVAVMNGEPVAVRRRKRPIEILFNLDHPDGPPVDLTEVEDDQDFPTIEAGDDEPEPEEEEEQLNIQQRLGRRTFVVASKQLLAVPTWVRVTEVFKGATDWTLLKPLGLQPDDPLYEKYSARLQRVRQIRDYPYVMQVLDRNVAYEEVAEIFVRVNSLGVKLRGSDLALAQVTARWKTSLKIFEEFAEELDEASWFTLDVGLLVRALVVFATHQSRFKTVQNVPVERLKQGWNDAKRGLQFAVNFLRTNAGIEDESLLSSPLIVVALAALGVVRNENLSADDRDQLLRWVLIANARGHYSRGSTETYLDQDLNVIFRGGSITDLMDLLRQQLGRLHVEVQDFVGRGARSPLFSTCYLALKQNGAQDWMSGLGLSLSHQGKIHYIEYHHIFPKSLLAHHGYEKAEINEIANMAFISGKANRKLLNKEPAQYLPEIVGRLGEDILIRHAIPTDPDLWRLDAYRDFLQWRRERLADEVNALLGTHSEHQELQLTT